MRCKIGHNVNVYTAVKYLLIFIVSEFYYFSQQYFHTGSILESAFENLFISDG